MSEGDHSDVSRSRLIRWRWLVLLLWRASYRCRVCVSLVMGGVCYEEAKSDASYSLLVAGWPGDVRLVHSAGAE